MDGHQERVRDAIRIKLLENPRKPCARTFPLLLVTVLALLCVPSSRVHAQDSADELTDGWGLSAYLGRMVSWNRTGERLYSSLRGFRFGSYRPENLGLELGGVVLDHDVGKDLLIDVGGVGTSAMGRLGAMHVHFGGSVGLLGVGGIWPGVYGGVGAVYPVVQNFGVTAELGGRWLIGLGRLSPTIGTGVFISLN